MLHVVLKAKGAFFLFQMISDLENLVELNVAENNIATIGKQFVYKLQR